MRGVTFTMVLEQGVKISVRFLCFRKRRPQIAYFYCVFCELRHKIAYVYWGFVSVSQKSLTFTEVFVIS